MDGGCLQLWQKEVRRGGLRGHLALYPVPDLGFVGYLGGESFPFFGACGETRLREKGQDSFLYILGKYYKAEKLDVDLSTVSLKLWPGHKSI